jgi:hypothetical protein
MYESNIEAHYRYDGTFRRVVDSMRSLLSMYHITPSELREAAIFAATMHMNENIRPLYVSYDEYGSGPTRNPDMEKWKAVKDFEAYEVSNLGRVRRKEATVHHPGKVMLKPWFGTGGYLQLQLFKDGKKYDKSVHILVAVAFIPNPKRLPEVNHLGPKSDCRASMLEWTNKRGNTIHAMKTGRVPKRHKDTPEHTPGVGFIASTGRWRARWQPTPYTREHIGVFDTFEEAKAARDAKVETL